MASRERLRLGVLGTSDIAFRRLLPALRKCGRFVYAGVASRDPARTERFVEAFGGRGFDGYQALLDDEDIDAVYLPLPPALHHEWGRKALAAGKHVLMEKPFTTCLVDTQELVSIARRSGLVVHENYAFVYHPQLQRIRQIVDEGRLGEVRLYRSTFGFPKRPASDFRYDRALGGGALLDCGGYPLRMAAIMLGNDARVTAARLNRMPPHGVDLYGSATLENTRGEVAQLAFGMDNSYRCELEIWGSHGNLLATRIFTAGEGFEPSAVVRAGNDEEVIKLPAADQFLRSIEAFEEAVTSFDAREVLAARILDQARLVDHVYDLGEQA
jgi:dTDP-3,4-didehydro-2,6-dideoxy-alpha-D-glucose 3-reductase